MPWMLPARSDWIIRSENVGSLILLLFEPINTVTSYDTCQVGENMKEGHDRPAASPNHKHELFTTAIVDLFPVARTLRGSPDSHSQLKIPHKYGTLPTVDNLDTGLWRHPRIRGFHAPGPTSGRR